MTWPIPSMASLSFSIRLISSPTRILTSQSRPVLPVAMGSFVRIDGTGKLFSSTSRRQSHSRRWSLAWCRPLGDKLRKCQNSLAWNMKMARLQSAGYTSTTVLWFMLPGITRLSGLRIASSTWFDSYVGEVDRLFLNISSICTVRSHPPSLFEVRMWSKFKIQDSAFFDLIYLIDDTSKTSTNTSNTTVSIIECVQETS